jgi:adenylate kinase family enzyme
MSNDEILEYMKERFDLMATSLDTMEKGINERLKSIEKEIKPLIEYKAKSEASISTLKYLVAFGIVVIPILISLINLYIKS